VYVNLRSEKETGRAKVVRLAEEYKQDSQEISDETDECFSTRYSDRIKVEFQNGDGTCHVRPTRIQKILTTDKLVVICKTTDEYRRFARSQLTPDDHVLEIGSSYGRCTEIIHLHTSGKVIGIDISSESVVASRLEYPEIRFERLDALQHASELRQLEREAAAASKSAAVDGTRCASHRRCKVFIDIGGDRECGAVVRMLNTVIDALEPCLVVVKSRNLFGTLAPLSPAGTDGRQPPTIPPGDSSVLAALRDAAAIDAAGPTAAGEPARLRKLARRLERRAAAQSGGAAAEEAQGTRAGADAGSGCACADGPGTCTGRDRSSPDV
jgi:hypothetical protein